MYGFRFLSLAAALGLCPAQGLWERRANYPLQATEVSAAAIDGKVYALCGLTPTGATNALSAYDPVSDRWTRRPLQRGGRQWRGGTSEYDPLSDRWQLVAQMPTPRRAGGVAAIGSKVYVAGGLAAGRSVAAFEVFDTTTRPWTRLPDMPTPRDHLTAQAVGGKFYALSGRVGDVVRANEEFDPETNTWRARSPIPTRGAFSAAASAAAASRSSEAKVPAEFPKVPIGRTKSTTR
jgi:N-acetylneuraminic acid mutarotase